MAESKDYYQILGIDKDADEATIKKAYRKLAKKYHPDVNRGDAAAEQKFKEIAEAYAVLGDKEKRKEYDTRGQYTFEGGNPFQNGFEGGFSRSFSGDEANDIMREIFGDMFGHGGFGTRYTNSGFGDGFQSNFTENSLDIEANMDITFDEAAFGCTKVVQLSDPSGGSSNRRIQVHIPAGINTGQSIRLQGLGHNSRGRKGDLLVKVNVGSKAGYDRKGLDVYTTLEIPYWTAVLGGEAKVNTLYGDVICKIKPGTQSGSKIRLKDKGIVSMRNASVHGDEYAEIKIAVPRHINKEAKQKLEEYRRLA